MSLVLVAGCGASAPTGPQASAVASPSGDLYQPPTPLPRANPGALIWAQRVSGLPLDPPATVWRLLYHSRSRTGADVAVSGYALVAASKPQAAGRPVYAWGHGTAGEADQCAPSKDIRDNLPPGGGEVIGRGGVVVASDYDGLGTPGIPTYYDGVAEGQAMLDAVRAASALPEVGSLGPVILAGHSQGGHAALFAAQLADSYAPELDLRGVVAMAPGAQLPELAAAVRGSAFRGLILDAADGLHAAYPELDPASFLTPQAVRDLPRVEHECVDATLARWRDTDPMLATPLAKLPVLRRVLEQNSPGRAAPGAPVLIAQGGGDQVIPAALSAQLESRYCALGATVARRLYPDDNHDTVVNAAIGDVLSWMADRLSGKAAPDDCRS